MGNAIFSFGFARVTEVRHIEVLCLVLLQRHIFKSLSCLQKVDYNVGHFSMAVKNYLKTNGFFFDNLRFFYSCFTCKTS